MNETLGRIHLTSILVCALVGVASLALLGGSISWGEYLDFSKWIVGLLAIGRGIRYAGAA